MATNPVSLSIPANGRGNISAVCNAAWYQRLTLTWAGGAAVFQGTGEGVAMTTAAGESAIPLPQAAEVTAKFESSRPGSSGTLVLAAVQNPIVTTQGAFTLVQVKSEDSTDNDFNDTFLTIVSVSFQSETVDVLSEGIAEATAADFLDPMADPPTELHAKTYYDNPSVQGGDEHYFKVPALQQHGSVGYQGMSWSMRESSFYDQGTPLGGYLHVYVKLDQCIHPGMWGRVLELYSEISYWGSRPSGSRTASWQWTVLGTGQHTVTDVTE